MAMFLILSTDGVGKQDERQAHRQVHIDYWTAMAGVVKVAGAMLDGDRSIGSALLVEAESAEHVAALAEGDPFTARGVFSGSPQVIPVRLSIGEWLPER